MLLTDNNYYSADKTCETRYLSLYITNTTYTQDPTKDYKSLKEPEINLMSLAYTTKAFSFDWDISDKEENEYWDSFLTESQKQ